MVLEEGYNQLSEYINARTKVLIECPEGHIFEITPNNWNKGRRCKECFKDRQRVRMKEKWLNTAETVVKSVNKSIDSELTALNTAEAVVNSANESIHYSLPVLSKKEYNKKEWEKFIKLNKKKYNKEEWGKFIKYIQTHSLFKFIGIAGSNDILKMELIHNTSGSSLEIWVLQSIDDNDKLPKGIVPIYLEDSDITTDLNYLKAWMKETHRNY